MTAFLFVVAVVAFAIYLVTKEFRYLWRKPTSVKEFKTKDGHKAFDVKFDD